MARAEVGLFIFSQKSFGNLSVLISNIKKHCFVIFCNGFEGL